MTSFWTAAAEMPEGDGRHVVVTETVVHDAPGSRGFVPPVAEEKSKQQVVEEELRMIVKTAFFSTLVHPFNYAQVLMQIGYEPFSAQLGRDIFGRPAYYLPSVFDYIQHIRKQTGTWGLFLGLGPTLAVTIGGVYVYRGAERLVKYLYDERYLGRPSHMEVKRFGFLEPSEQNVNLRNALRFEPKETVGVTYTAANFAEDLAKEITVVSISMAATWPLQVIAFRTMAQFIGGEHLYDGLLNAVQEIANTEGISGFFRGLFPMWYSYVAITSCTYVAVFAYASYNNINPINLRLVAAGAGAVVNSFFYPLKLTSRMFAVSGARLAAARPPKMPNFARWNDMYNYLIASGESKRGSSMIFRKIPLKPAASPSVERTSSGVLHRAHSFRGGDDWSQKYTSAQLMARHGAGLMRFSL